jgi:RNA polymerase sigma factor (sigma-70 family)
LTEEEIIQGCLIKDERSQHTLFQQYAGKLMAVCQRYASDQKEAEDMLQEAFIRIFSNIHQFRNAGPFGGWVKKITVNAAIQVLRNKKIRFSEFPEDQTHLLNTDPNVFSDLGAEELLKLISQLPEGYRVVFNLYVLEGYTHEEIAQILHIRTATSRSQLSKARAALKEKINSIQKIPG